MAHNKLYRNFIILQGDEKKISDDKACSGYAKIEAKGDKCKISFYAQNLSQEKNYSIVLICYKKDFKQVVDLGSLKIKEGGKGEVTKEYYVNNIAGLGIDYSKISGAAVTVDDTEDSELASNVYNEITEKYKDYTIYTGGEIAERNEPALPAWIVVLEVVCALVILIIMCESYVKLFFVFNINTNSCFTKQWYKYNIWNSIQYYKFNISYITNGIINGLFHNVNE